MKIWLCMHQTGILAAHCIWWNLSVIIFVITLLMSHLWTEMWCCDVVFLISLVMCMLMSKGGFTGSVTWQKWLPSVHMSHLAWGIRCSPNMEQTDIRTMWQRRSTRKGTFFSSKATIPHALFCSISAFVKMYFPQRFKNKRHDWEYKYFFSGLHGGDVNG